MSVPRLSLPVRESGWRRSVCPYCGVGCGLSVRARDGVVAEVRADRDHPVNAGQLCAKGALLAPAIAAEDRLLYPLVRSRETGGTKRVSWDDAVQRVATGILDAVAEYGPDSVMLYGSGQLMTEDYYLFGKLAKGFIGTNNQDTNSRLCMASAVAAYQLAFGEDAPPTTYADIEQANTFLIVGANMEACHPILFNRIKARKRAGGDRVKVIVVDPRRTKTAEIADIHLAVAPGADVPLLNGLLYEAMLGGWLDGKFIAEHTEGWEQFRSVLPRFQAELVEAATGTPAQQVVDAARMYASNGPALTFWAMGVNQSTSGVDKSLAIINLALATGNIGKPGSGPFSLTGQANAMGGREAGGLATSLPGHRSVADPCHRVEVEAAWGLPPGSISPRRGLTAIEMVEALERGDVRVVWIACTNPLVSLPNSDRVRAALERADLVVVQDAYHPTETTQVADIVLPAAQWSEREGTLTNSERRVCLLERVGDPPGEALPDWQIVCAVAAALGHGEAFDYPSSEEIFDEYRALTRGRDLDITGVTYDLLRRTPGVQWPYPKGAEAGTERLYTDARFPTPSGRAVFNVPQVLAPADEVTAEYPMVLLTGRVKDQWHTRTRTGKVPKLNRADPTPFVEVHPDDARALRVRGGQLVRVTSRRGAAELPVRVTDAIRPGTVFAPFHWGALWGGGSVANSVTSEAFDARSRQPELKFAAVRLEAI
ncbi:MAG: molybdopterin-dependent oxidoreductase [Dehalococcoidia bacterium]|nr:molybdopterin-dependent oxidoreductase [Dehalococcoidia bacterium]